MSISTCRRPRLFALVLGAALLLLSVGRPPRAAVLSPADRHVTPPDVDALAERVRTKVVFIEVHIGQGGRGGTGFFAAPGRVLTSEHVIRGADRITVWSNGEPYRARVIGRALEQDLALLALSDAALLIKPLALAERGSSYRDEPILIVGTHPAPTAASVRQSLIAGRFLSLSWFEWPVRYYSPALELSAHVEPGDSGSPVIRVRDGAVIGVVRAREIPSSDGLSFRAWAVPIDVAFPLLGRAPDRTQQAARPNPDEEFYLRRP